MYYKYFHPVHGLLFNFPNLIFFQCVDGLAFDEISFINLFFYGLCFVLFVFHLRYFCLYLLVLSFTESSEINGYLSISLFVLLSVLLHVFGVLL